MKIPVLLAALLLAGPALAQDGNGDGPTLMNNMQNLAGPTMEQATKAAQAAVVACKAKGSAVGVTVTDATGGLRIVLGSDGATAADANGSRRSAELAAASKMSGADILAKMKGDKAYADRITANTDWLARGGAVLIKVGDKLVGVISVEGHPHDDVRDASCAQAGIDAIKSQLH